MDQCLQELTHWLNKELSSAHFQLKTLEGDAGYRRYFRVCVGDMSYVVMDLGEESSSCGRFVSIARAFLDNNIHAPEILAVHPNSSLVLMEDLGESRYQDILDVDNVDHLYQSACASLNRIHQIESIPKLSLPRFDATVMAEQLQRFNTWFLAGLLQWPVGSMLSKTLTQQYGLLITSALEQPTCTIHCDYHSRNLMVCPNGDVGVLDFQDAAIGPVTYDLVSLLRDCYIDWPADEVVRWSLNFYEALKATKLTKISSQQFLQWFDWMGIQRHLKATYIFARKFLRDKDNYYLRFIPRTLAYVRSVSEQYAELQPLHRLISDVLPKFEQIL